MNSLPAPISIRISEVSHVNRAAKETLEFARSIGFAPPECEQLALAATELASNLVKHAGSGSLTLSALINAERRGIQMDSEDKGPGIPDAELALTDGYSTAGGLGTGLGAVNRLMDELEFHQAQPRGVHIVSQRWIRPATTHLSTRRLECGAATRACQRAPENGDAIVVRQWEDNALLGVIDGLGHGPLAQKASHAARQYLEQHFDQPLTSLFRGVGRVCRATRGVVMALARFDLQRQTVTLASVGNVEIRLVGNSSSAHLVARRGILGFNAPEPLVTEHSWKEADLLVIHTDGLESHWKWDDFKALAPGPTALIARQLLAQKGKLEDDATVVVAKNARA